eukprot:5779682-Pyramimonas_sp.AAC.1
MSEHAGVALCGQVANRPAQLGADCMSAIKLAQKELAQQLSVRGKFAGIRKFAHTLEGTAFIQEVRHVKAHRSQDLIDSVEQNEREYAESNRIVDHHAKEAVRAQPSADPSLLQELEVAVERAAHF